MVADRKVKQDLAMRHTVGTLRAIYISTSKNENHSMHSDAGVAPGRVKGV